MKISNNEAASIAELWASIKNYISQKDRQQAAQHFLTTVQDNAILDLEECASELHGVCSTLDRALKDYVVEEDYDEYEEELEY
jgi:predicted transcriptional regulator